MVNFTAKASKVDKYGATNPNHYLHTADGYNIQPGFPGKLPR